MKTPRLALPMVVLLAFLVPAAASFGQATKAGKPRAVDTIKYPKLHDIKMPAVVRETLPNGMKLLLVEDHDMPQISFRATVRGGKLAEPAGRNGLTELFGEVQRTGGAGAMSGDKVDSLLDSLGAEVETSVNEASGVVEGKVLTETFDKVLPVLAEILTKPAFAPDKVELGKTHMRSGISRRNDQVQGIAFREFQKLIYGASSPYARQIEYDDVEKLTREDLVAFHAAHYRPDTTILAVWGDFSVAEMKTKLGAAFAQFKAAGPRPTVVAASVPSQSASLNYIEKKDVEQTFLLAGQRGLRLDDPDYPAIWVMSDILGGGFASRIFVKVRTEKGLAYAAGGGMFPAMDHVGAFYFFTSTKPSTTAEALAAMLGEIKKIREAPVSDAELQRSKEGYLNGYAFEYDSTGKIVNRLATYDLYGYPTDFNVKLRDAIEKVSKDDVLRVARKYLDPDALSVLAIGRKDQFDRPLDSFGKVTTLDITIPEPKPKETLAEATPESIAKGKALLAKAAAHAGGAALAGVKDLTAEGSATMSTPMGQMDLKVKVTFVLPDRSVNDLTTPMGAMVQVLDGDHGFMKMGPQSQPLPERAIVEMKRSLYTDFGCLRLLKEGPTGTPKAWANGVADFEGKKADDVLVSVGDSVLHVYLAPDTAEVLGTRRTAQTEEGATDVVTVYSNYQTVSGLKLPFASVQKVKGEVKADAKLATVKVNAGFNEEIFKAPAPPQK
jgi:zinc protease